MKRRFRKLSICLMILILLLSTGANAYANEYHDARDGNISLYLPEGWETYETGIDESEDKPYEKILEASDKSGKTDLHLEIYFMIEDVNNEQYYYLSSNQEEALAYFNDYGKEAINSLYLNSGGYDTVTIGTAVFYDGEWDGFLTVPVTGTLTDGSAFADTVYLTCNMSNDSDKVIHNILMFYKEDNSLIAEADVDTVKSIVDEFYDYGYYNIMAGDQTESWDEEEVDFEAVIVALMIPLVVIMVLIIIVKRIKRSAGHRPVQIKYDAKRNRNGGTKINKNQNSSQDWVPAEVLNRKNTPEKHDHIGDIMRASERKGSRDSGDLGQREGYARRRPTDSESRYFESLRTLRKSGLLTREEMSDMLERHERNKYRRR